MQYRQLRGLQVYNINTKSLLPRQTLKPYSVCILVLSLSSPRFASRLTIQDMAEEIHDDHDIHGDIEEHDALGIPAGLPPAELPPSDLSDSHLNPDDFPSSDLPPSDLPSEDSEFPQAQAVENTSIEHAEEKWPGWPGHNVFRILVPAQKVGSIIGRKGENIKKMCEETKARIKVLDGPPGTSERAVMVSAKEEPELPMPPALDALLRVHKQLVDLDGDVAPAPGQTIITRMLVAATQAGSLIGKQGSTIKIIQDGSGCVIRVLGGENLPLFALQDDSIVEIQGETAGVHKAVELIASHLRKFLVDHGIVSVFEKQMQSPTIQGNQNMPPPQHWGPPQGFPRNAGGGSNFESYSQYMQPPPQFDNYYPPADFPQEKQSRSRQPPPMFGRDAPVGVSPSSAPSQPSIVSKVTQNMQIPLAYADAVIGSSGSNISYIRRSSGASISIQETRGVPGEMTVEISGSAAQIQAAQQMIQNAIAEAANSAQNAAANSMSQGYGSYATHGQVYGSPSSHSMAHAGQAPAADYGSLYNTHYGY